MRTWLVIFLLVSTVFAGGCVDIGEEPGIDKEYEIVEVAQGMSSPWGITQLENKFLITEKQGELKAVDRNTGDKQALEGVPEVDGSGQGGLLDVEIHPDFSDNELVYLTYSANNEDSSATHLGRGELNLERGKIDGFEVLHVAEPFKESGSHYGSRVVFDEDGYLYFTIGDRGEKDFGEDHVSQNTSNELGATLRLEDDGSIPEDNPFVNKSGIKESIYSYGHRNVQGMTVHPETGEIWQSEHGEEDGDEINIAEPGNYGWPVTHTGCEYGTDQPVAEDPQDNPDVKDPVYYWECGTGGFPPAGITFYTGEAFPDWEGDLLVGNLAGQYLGSFEVNGTEVQEKEPLLEQQDWRVRDVEVEEDTGYIYILIDEDDAPLVRLEPRNN